MATVKVGVQDEGTGQVSSRKILVTWFYSRSEPEREGGEVPTGSFGLWEGSVNT